MSRERRTVGEATLVQGPEPSTLPDGGPWLAERPGPGELTAAASDLPDDLPRSPTGRIPRWVIEEWRSRDALPSPPVEPHTGAAPPAAPAAWAPRAAGPGRRRPRWVPLGITLAVVLAMVITTLRHAPRTADDGAATAQVASNASYRFLSTQPDGSTPVTFSSCRPIHYLVRRSGAPERGAEALRSALDEVSRATGLQFVSDGSVDGLPVDGRVATLDGTGTVPPVLIAWQSPAENPTLAGDVAGEAGPQRVTAGEHPAMYVSGTVRLDGPQLGELLQEQNGFDRVRGVILHELGHLVGLGHTDDPSQLMYPENGEATVFADGDLAGLAQLGRGPCADWL